MSRLLIHTHGDTAFGWMTPSELRVHLIEAHGYVGAEVAGIASDDLDGEHEWAHSDG